MKRFKILVFCVLIAGTICGQEAKPPFWNDIQVFKKQDSAQPPPKNSILFIGSSSFTRWIDIDDYFPGYSIINRGFGGSTLSDLIRFADHIIFSYQPQQIVIYCGENDIASDEVTVAMVFSRFKQLHTAIREKLPNVSLVYISMKPSPSRWRYKQKIIETNESVRKYLKKDKKAVFVNIWKQMLGPDGRPWEALFVEDQLHMNAKGYAIWQKALKPYLKPDK